MAQVIQSPNISMNNVTIPYLSILGVMGVVLLFSLLWRPLNLDRTKYIPLSPQVETTVKTPKNLPISVGNGQVEIIDDKSAMQLTLESSDTPEDDNLIPDSNDDDNIVDKNNNVQYTIARGDTLHDVLLNYNVNSKDVYQLTNQFKQLANLRIGQQISWTTDDNNGLLTFNWTISGSNIRVYEKSGDRFVESLQKIESIAKRIVLQGEIETNFIADARKSGLTNSEISMIIRILQWKLNFRRLREGDKFLVSLSRDMHGNKLLNSQILGVRVLSGKRNYYAILADDGNYYDLDGDSLLQSFLRYPLAKRARIASGFNPRRLHPVTRAITPHNGVDFAVSRKTPVLSVGDGEVKVSKYSPSAGYYITLQHGRQYVTRYMHLDKLLVKPGQSVKRGEVIALSGNTGRSTGPHLHYELIINNKPVNPITANLPVAEGLTGKSKTVFLEKMKEIKAELAL